MTGPANVVVVGAGLAGLRATEELRARGFTGSLTLIGAEDRGPYDRPPLSKKVLTGELDDTSLRADLTPLDVNVRLGEPAVALEPGALRTAAAEYRWDALVVATGARPVRLPGDGEQLTLRTADDSLRLRERLSPGARLVIVGAGWIGAELATAARRRGCDVTVLEAASSPLLVAVGAEVGRVTADWYAEAGVHLRLGEGVAAIEPGGVTTSSGDWIPADVVVTAVGVRPETGWLAGSDVAVDNGVTADGQLRTSMPGVFAAGDCASFWSGRYQHQLRFEHWDIALHAPEVAAANVLGGAESYDPVPYFWSEQFGRMVQYVGWHGAADQLIWRGDRETAKWAVAWLAGGRLVAALTVGLPRDLLQARRLIEAGAAVDAARLADPAVAVRDAALDTPR